MHYFGPKDSNLSPGPSGPHECSDMRIVHMILTLSYSHEWGVQQHKKLVPAPEAGEKVEHHLISITKTTDFSFCPLEVHWVKNLNVGICDGATSTARSSHFIILSCFFFQGPHCLKRLY